MPLPEFGMTTNPLSKNVRYAEQYGFRGSGGPTGFGDECRFQPER